MELGEYTKEELQLHFEFGGDEQLEHTTYKGWGVFYEKKRLLDKAINANNDACEIKSEYIPVIFNKGRCLLKDGEPQKALEDTEQCLAKKPKNLKFNHQKIDCTYELNDLEEALKVTHDVSQLNNMYINKRECSKRLHFLKTNFDQSIGVESGPMLFKMRKIIAKIQAERARPVFKGPLWKYRILNKECDVDSIADINSKVMNPLNKHRRKLNLSIVNHLYLDRSAHDLQFIANLQNDKRLDLPQCTENSKHILKIAKETQNKIEKWRTMLKTRQPVYSKQYEMVRSNEGVQKYNRSILHRKQFQIRRDIFKQLQISRQLAAAGEYDQLGKYVSKVLGSFYTIHPIREMPRKFEFTNELCNIVAIAYLSQISVPNDIMICNEEDRIRHILGVPLEKQFQQVKGERKFGERPPPSSTAENLDTIQKTNILYLETSMALSQYPIESCFYSYEISKLYFSELRFDAIRFNANQVIEQANLCNNYAWMYLGNFMLARADGAQNFYDNLKIILQKMDKIALKLNDKVRHFNMTVSKLNLAKIKKIDEEIRRIKEIEEAEDNKRVLKRAMLLKK